MRIDIKKIKPNPTNDEIYTSTDLSTLKQSLERNGQLEPIVINKQNLIISGHRRYFSMIQLGWKEVEVRVADYENETIALIEHNQTRMKNATDIQNEFRILEQEYRKELGGQGKRTDLKGEKRFNIYVEIANKTGVGLSKLKQIQSIHNYEPELLEKIDSGEHSVASAYKIVQEKYINKIKKDRNKDDIQKSKLKKFLEKEQIDISNVVDVLNDTYPYSIAQITADEIEELKKKD
jgi:ParB-like chromosome segregation protein Spo0J